MRPFAFSLFALASCAAVIAPTVTPRLLAAPASAPQTVLIKGTNIPLRLETDLRSGRSKTGDPVLFTVAQNVYGPNHTLLLEKGTLAQGQVTLSAGHGAFGRSGKLTFTCDAAETNGGVKIPLHLVVSPSAENQSASGSSEIAASVSTRHSDNYDDAQRDAYANRYTPDDARFDGLPGGYYPGSYSHGSGAAAAVSVDPARLLGNGADITADRGQVYDASVAADTSLAAVSVPTSALTAPRRQLFTLKDKTQVIGVLNSFDGQTYTVVTLSGPRTLLASAVQSIQSVSLAP